MFILSLNEEGPAVGSTRLRVGSDLGLRLGSIYGLPWLSLRLVCLCLTGYPFAGYMFRLLLLDLVGKGKREIRQWRDRKD